MSETKAETPYTLDSFLALIGKPFAALDTEIFRITHAIGTLQDAILNATDDTNETKQQKIIKLSGQIDALILELQPVCAKYKKHRELLDLLRNILIYLNGRQPNTDKNLFSLFHELFNSNAIATLHELYPNISLTQFLALCKKLFETNTSLFSSSDLVLIQDSLLQLDSAAEILEKGGTLPKPEWQQVLADAGFVEWVINAMREEHFYYPNFSGKLSEQQKKDLIVAAERMAKKYAGVMLKEITVQNAISLYLPTYASGLGQWRANGVCFDVIGDNRGAFETEIKKQFSSAPQEARQRIGDLEKTRRELTRVNSAFTTRYCPGLPQALFDLVPSLLNLHKDPIKEIIGFFELYSAETLLSINFESFVLKILQSRYGNIKEIEQLRYDLAHNSDSRISMVFPLLTKDYAKKSADEDEKTFASDLMTRARNTTGATTVPTGKSTKTKPTTSLDTELSPVSTSHAKPFEDWQQENVAAIAEAKQALRTAYLSAESERIAKTTAALESLRQAYAKLAKEVDISQQIQIQDDIAGSMLSIKATRDRYLSAEQWGKLKDEVQQLIISAKAFYVQSKATSPDISSLLPKRAVCLAAYDRLTNVDLSLLSDSEVKTRETMLKELQTMLKNAEKQLLATPDLLISAITEEQLRRLSHLIEEAINIPQTRSETQPGENIALQLRALQLLKPEFDRFDFRFEDITKLTLTKQQKELFDRFNALRESYLQVVESATRKYNVMNLHPQTETESASDSKRNTI